MENENKEKELRKAALSGDPEAMLRFAIYWQEERKDAEEAGNWYRRAAEAGSKEAFLRIGKILFNLYYGKDGPDYLINIDKVADYFYKALNPGYQLGDVSATDAEAMFYLGRCFYRSLEFNPCPCTDNPQAFDWFLRASNAGHLEAKYKIGEIYYEGHCGQKKSIKKAIEIFREIAESDDYDPWKWEISSSKTRLAEIYKEIGDKMHAAYWYYRDKDFWELKTMAEDGCREAQMLIAKAALEGDNEAKGYVKEGYAADFENATLEELSKEFSLVQDGQQNGQLFMGWLRSLFGKMKRVAL